MAFNWIQSFIRGAAQVSDDRRAVSTADAMDEYQVLNRMEESGAGRVLRIIEYRSEGKQGAEAYIEVASDQRVYDGWIWGDARPPVGTYFLAPASVGPGRKSDKVLYVGTKRRAGQIVRELDPTTSTLVTRELQRRAGSEFAA